MRKSALAICAAAAVGLVSGCAGGTGYVYEAWPGYWGGPDVWYDGYYGPYPSGYWGPDMAFYYRDTTGHFVRDAAGHFRGQRFSGAHGYRAQHPPR